MLRLQASFFPIFRVWKEDEEEDGSGVIVVEKDGTMPVISLLADRAELALRSQVFNVYFPCPRCGEFDG